MVTRKIDSPNTPDLNHARDELRDGIESSRQIVRQTHVLIELSESRSPFVADNDNSRD